jgi:hypothetical protein
MGHMGDPRRGRGEDSALLTLGVGLHVLGHVEDRLHLLPLQNAGDDQGMHRALPRGRPRARQDKTGQQP